MPVSLAVHAASEIDHEAALEAAGATDPEAESERSSPVSMDTATASTDPAGAVIDPEPSDVGVTVSEPSKPKPKLVARLVAYSSSFGSVDQLLLWELGRGFLESN